MGQPRAARRAVLLDQVASLLAEQVAGLEPAPARALVDRTIPSARRLGWLHRHLQAHPDALSSGSSEVPLAVVALAHDLHQAGHRGVVLPACARCGATSRRLARSAAKGRLCPGCARPQARCGRCGRVRPVVVRDRDGPVCGGCYAADPARFEPCAGCGQRRRVLARRADGSALCGACYQPPLHECSRCGQRRPAWATTGDGAVCEACYAAPPKPCGGCGLLQPLTVGPTATQPGLCERCYRGRTGPCARCGHDRRIHATWPLGQVCGTCYQWIRRHPAACTRCGACRPVLGHDPAGAGLCGPCLGVEVDHACRQCGAWGFLPERGRCERCLLTDRVHQLLAGEDGQLHADLEPFARALVEVDSPGAVLQWLAPAKPAATLLTRLVASGQPITHELLDTLPQTLACHRLRQTLVHTGVLPERADYLERLVPWLEQLLADQPAPRVQLLRTFANWTLLRRARTRTQAQNRPFTHGANDWARARLRASLRLLAWLDERGTSLADLSQHDLDQWVTTQPPDTAYPAREFINWARRSRLVGDVAIPKRRPRSTLAAITDDERWAQLRRCLHDPAVPLAVRAAASLVLLYALPLTRVSALRSDDLHHDSESERTYLQVGAHRLRLVPAVAGLVLAQRDQASSVAAVHHAGGDPPAWLFPGGFPGRPSRTGLARQFRRHNLPLVRPARAAALIALAGELPAPVLADLVGITTRTAVGWSHHAQHDWAVYLEARATAQTTAPGQVRP
jgi:recombinational DNA repair protein (RecF pathway)